jgi:hypothetical protein
MLAFILVMYNNTDTGNGRKIIGMINLWIQDSRFGLLGYRDYVGL